MFCISYRILVMNDEIGEWKLFFYHLIMSNNSLSYFLFNSHVFFIGYLHGITSTGPVLISTGPVTSNTNPVTIYTYPVPTYVVRYRGV